MSDFNKYVNFNVEDFPENYQEVVNIVGVEKAIELSTRFGGNLQYIPKLDDIHRRVRNAKIKSEFTGYNIQELSIKYSLTDIQIRTILKIRETTIEDFIKGENNELE